MAIVSKEKPNKEYGDVTVLTLSEISDSINKFGPKDYLNDLIKSGKKKVLLEVDVNEVIRPSLTSKKFLDDLSRSTKMYVSSKDPDPKNESKVIDWFFNNIGKNFTFVELIKDDSIQVENYGDKLKDLGKSCNRKGVKLLIINSVKGVSGSNEYTKIHSDLLSNSVRFEKLSKI